MSSIQHQNRCKFQFFTIAPNILRHIIIFLEKKLDEGQIIGKHIPTSEMPADTFTKALGRIKFEGCCTRLGLTNLPPSVFSLWNILDLHQQIDQIELRIAETLWSNKNSVCISQMRRLDGMMAIEVNIPARPVIVIKRLVFLLYVLTPFAVFLCCVCLQIGLVLTLCCLHDLFVGAGPGMRETSRSVGFRSVT